MQKRVLQSCGLKTVLGDFLSSKCGNPDENTQQSYLEFLGMKTVRFKDLKTESNKPAINSFITGRVGMVTVKKAHEFVMLIFHVSVSHEDNLMYVSFNSRNLSCSF